MENHKTHNLKQEPHLSGAYIRTLVKHLTSIKTKNLPESVNSKEESPPPPPLSPSLSPPPQKKQVRRRRRRQHTSKPYQERLLNMAEARREIVTALQFHRASMKQRETAAAAVTAAAVPYYPGPPPLPPLNQENGNLDFILPNQTLGLNLNFQDFMKLDTNLYHNPLSNYPITSSSSSSLSSSASSSSQSTSSSGMLEEVVATSAATTTIPSSSAIMDGGLHHAMDDDGMEEIRSLGEQYQMEWNDTVNLLMSARWFKFLKTIEIKQEDGKFDQLIEFSPCMDIGEIEGIDGEWLA